MKQGGWAWLVLALVVGLSGCGGNSGSSSEGSEGGGGGTGGRLAASPGNHSGKSITVVMIPKLKGIPYFNACQKGAEEAARGLPGVNLQYVGTIDASADKQIELIDSWIVKKPDVIAVSCNNPDELAPVLKRARDKGIHVITWDADASPTRSGREFFVDQATPESIGSTLVDVMAKEAGPDASAVVITSTLTAPNQSEWLRYMEQRVAKSYPKMKIQHIYPSFEDQSKAFTAAQDALKAYPEVKGIWGISSTAFPGAAEAVKAAGKAGKIAVTGLATPQQMKPYVDQGEVKTVVLWNPIDLGYLTVYVAKAVADGSLTATSKEVSAGRLGKKQVSGGQVILGPPMLFTKENIGKFNF